MPTTRSSDSGVVAAAPARDYAVALHRARTASSTAVAERLAAPGAVTGAAAAAAAVAAAAAPAAALAFRCPRVTGGNRHVSARKICTGGWRCSSRRSRQALRLCAARTHHHGPFPPAPAFAAIQLQQRLRRRPPEVAGRRRPRQQTGRRHTQFVAPTAPAPLPLAARTVQVHQAARGCSVAVSTAAALAAAQVWQSAISIRHQGRGYRGGNRHQGQGRCSGCGDPRPWTDSDSPIEDQTSGEPAVCLAWGVIWVLVRRSLPNGSSRVWI